MLCCVVVVAQVISQLRLKAGKGPLHTGGGAALPHPSIAEGRDSLAALPPSPFIASRTTGGCEDRKGQRRQEGRGLSAFSGIANKHCSRVNVINMSTAG